MKLEGMVRLEVKVRREDAALVRKIAGELVDPERAASARAFLRGRFGESRRSGLKALLAAAPLEGIELERTGDTGRKVDL
jgi:hypothetical protein